MLMALRWSLVCKSESMGNFIHVKRIVTEQQDKVFKYISTQKCILNKKQEIASMCILTAEDEVELAKGLKFLLEKNKFSVDIVHDGADAMDCFHYTEYDVIVLDIMMPKINGLEVLCHIRKRKSSVPVWLRLLKAMFYFCE